MGEILKITPAIGGGPARRGRTTAVFGRGIYEGPEITCDWRVPIF